MNSNPTLSYAIATILSSGEVVSAYATPAVDADTAADQLKEITVTAQRRVENVQNVPITIQAFTAETLSKLNVETFDEILRYLPNVTNAVFGPGSKQYLYAGAERWRHFQPRKRQHQFISQCLDIP